MNDTWYSTASDAEKETFKNWLRNELANNDVSFEFIKKDGSLRKMKATLQEEALPPKIATEKPKKENAEVISVWDLDLNAWRSVRYESIRKIEATLYSRKDSCK